MVSYYIAEFFDKISTFFYFLRLNKIGKKFNNISDYFYRRGWWSWNSRTRALTIPYTEIGSQNAGSVTINISKDMVVNDGEYHATEATEEIWLWLSTHPKSEYPNDPSIKIPVSSLIDEMVDSDSVERRNKG